MNMKKLAGLFLSLALMVSTMAVTASAATFSGAEAEQLRAQITAMAVVDSVAALIVKLLTLGADDYLKKPLDISLCHAKICALFRRCFDEKFVQKSPYVSNRTGDLLVSPLYQRIFLKGVEIVLPRKQFELFYLLFSNGRQKVPGTAFRHAVSSKHTISLVCCFCPAGFEKSDLHRHIDTRQEHHAQL